MDSFLQELRNLTDMRPSHQSSMGLWQLHLPLFFQ